MHDIPPAPRPRVHDFASLRIWHLFKCLHVFWVSSRVSDQNNVVLMVLCSTCDAIAEDHDIKMAREIVVGGGQTPRIF